MLHSDTVAILQLSRRLPSVSLRVTVGRLQIHSCCTAGQASGRQVRAGRVRANGAGPEPPRQGLGAATVPDRQEGAVQQNHSQVWRTIRILMRAAVDAALQVRLVRRRLGRRRQARALRADPGPAGDQSWRAELHDRV